MSNVIDFKTKREEKIKNQKYSYEEAMHILRVMSEVSSKMDIYRMKIKPNEKEDI